MVRMGVKESNWPSSSGFVWIHIFFCIPQYKLNVNHFLWYVFQSKQKNLFMTMNVCCMCVYLFVLVHVSIIILFYFNLFLFLSFIHLRWKEKMGENNYSTYDIWAIVYLLSIYLQQHYIRNNVNIFFFVVFSSVVFFRDIREIPLNDFVTYLNLSIIIASAHKLFAFIDDTIMMCITHCVTQKNIQWFTQLAHTNAVTWSECKMIKLLLWEWDIYSLVIIVSVVFLCVECVRCVWIPLNSVDSIHRND